MYILVENTLRTPQIFAASRRASKCCLIPKSLSVPDRGGPYPGTSLPVNHTNLIRVSTVSTARTNDITATSRSSLGLVWHKLGFQVFGSPRTSLLVVS